MVKIRYGNLYCVSLSYSQFFWKYVDSRARIKMANWWPKKQDSNYLISGVYIAVIWKQRDGMEAKPVVFAAGVHGVGKGYLCGKLASIIDGEHITASNLIKNRKKLGSAKAISGIDANQAILVEELAKFDTAKPVVLLDGHFCLYNKEFEIEFLPPALFKELNVSYIVMLICSPSVIIGRLMKRDKNIANLSIFHIDQLQKAELKHSHVISELLNIPITLIDVTDDTTSDLTDLSCKIRESFRL